MNKLLLAILLGITLAGCSTNAVVRDLQRSGCLIKSYHARSQTGEIKVECYKVKELGE